MARFILGPLGVQGVIRWGERTGGMPMGVADLTVAGYRRIAELEREEREIDSDQVFVAMWFDASMDEAYEKGIKLAIEDADIVACGSPAPFLNVMGRCRAQRLDERPIY